MIANILPWVYSKVDGMNPTSAKFVWKLNKPSEDGLWEGT